MIQFQKIYAVLSEAQKHITYCVPEWKSSFCCSKMSEHDISGLLPAAEAADTVFIVLLHL
jgi:hypothetical protein